MVKDETVAQGRVLATVVNGDVTEGDPIDDGIRSRKTDRSGTSENAFGS